MRNKNLDGARGLAALSVALAHCATVIGGVAVYASTVRNFETMPIDAVALRFWHSAFNGDAAVILFFALSGFVLGRSLERGGDAPLQAFFPYLIKRACRLLPATIAAGLLAFLLEPVTVRQMIGAMFIYDNSANGVLWSLQVEVIGSILIFMLWASGSRILVGALIAFYAYAFWFVPLSIMIVRSEFIMLPAAFVLGYSIPAIPDNIWRSRVLFAAGLATLLLSDVLMGRTWHTRIGQVLGSFVVVGCLQANPFRLLNARIPQFLGNVSYSFYLIHPLLLGGGFAILSRMNLTIALPLKALVLALITIPAALAGGYLASEYIEKPGIRLGRFLTERLRASVTATPAS